MKNITNVDARKRSQKTFELIFENSLDAILLIEPSTGSILMANPAACKMFSMTEDELKQVGREGVMVMDDTAVAALEQRNREGTTFTIKIPEQKTSQ